MAQYQDLAGHEEELYKSLHQHMSDTLDEDMSEEFNDVVYQGFDQKKMRSIILYHFKPESISLLATIGALRGSTKARTDPKLKAISVQYRPRISSAFSSKTIEQLFNDGILHKEKGADSSVGTASMTIQRFTHSFPDLAALSLYKMNQKGLLVSRVSEQELALHLQFPAAASLPLSEKGVKQVKDFCIAFSPLLKTKKDGKVVAGEFSESIFNQQRTNEVKSVATKRLAQYDPETFKENGGFVPTKSSESGVAAMVTLFIQNHQIDPKAQFFVKAPVSKQPDNIVAKMTANLPFIKNDANKIQVANAMAKIWQDGLINENSVVEFLKELKKRSKS
jgi:hypothetical protein